MPSLDSAQLVCDGVILNLTLPLQRKRPSRYAVVHKRTSLDGTAHSARRVGTGQYAAWVTIRYEGDRSNLVDFLIKAIEEGEEVTYTPDTNVPANSDAFVVIEPESVKDALQLGADAPAIADEWDTVELLCMKQDGTDFDHIYSV